MLGYGQWLQIANSSTILDFCSTFCRTSADLLVSIHSPFCCKLLLLLLLLLFMVMIFNIFCKQRLSNLRIHDNFNCNLCREVAKACVHAGALDFGLCTLLMLPLLFFHLWNLKDMRYSGYVDKMCIQEWRLCGSIMSMDWLQILHLFTIYWYFWHINVLNSLILFQFLIGEFLSICCRRMLRTTMILNCWWK